MTSGHAEQPAGSRITTRFGAFDVPQQDIVTFPDGIPGFEQCRRFVLILADELSPLSCLQALDPPYPSFLAADPASLRPDYLPQLTDADRHALEASDGPLLWLTILTVSLHEVTANLRAPVVINPATMKGRQVLLEGDTYPVRWPVEAR